MTFGPGTTFEGATFADDVDFSDCIFLGAASFANAIFLESACFGSAEFTGHAHFDRSRFHRGADFNLARFGRLAIFDYVRFEEDGKSGRLKFRDAVFESTTKFYRATFAQRLDHFSNAFSGARFLDFVDFTGAGTHWVAALNDAVFEKAVSLPRPSESAAEREFRDVVLEAVDAAVQEDVRREPERPEHQHRAWRLEQIEGGCRNLKNVLGRDRDEILEQRYYRFQLIARRKQVATPRTEKLFSILYGLTSNYGASIGQPLASVAVVILAFAVVSWLIKAGAVDATTMMAQIDEAIPHGQIDKSFREALSFSLSRVFPFGAFDEVSKHWVDGFETNKTVATLGVRVLASIESVIALALVFVFGLAIRRKFQMN